jgi:hypothetical protein
MIWLPFPAGERLSPQFSQLGSHPEANCLSIKKDDQAARNKKQGLET